MKLLIVIHHRFNLRRVPALFVEKVANDFPQVQVVNRDSYDGVEDDLRDAEVIFTISLRPEELSLCRQLQWIHTPTAAVHQFQFPKLINSDVVLTHSTEVHGPVVAEHVITQIFALAKKIPQIVVFQPKHVWGQEAVWNSSPRPREVAGATLGLIGVITPHTAGLTEKLWHRHYEHFSANLRRYLAKEPLQYTVDKRKGY